jgi:hypothetical protein
LAPAPRASRGDSGKADDDNVGDRFGVAADVLFAGELRVERYRGDELVESHTDDALWELMYFGKARS